MRLLVLVCFCFLFCACSDSASVDASSGERDASLADASAADLDGAVLPAFDYPNRPAFYTTVITDYAFDTPLPDGQEVAVSDGWWTAWNSRALMRISTDSSAPKSGPNVLEWAFTKDDTMGGGGVGNLYRSFSNPTSQVYVAMWLKHDANFEWNAISNKLLYLEPGNIILQSRHYDEYLSVWIGALSTNVAPTNNQVIPTGEWVFIEYLVDATNGRIQVWMNDTLTLDYSGSVPANWTSLKLDSTWGGGGTKTRDSWRWIDHILVATP